MVMADLTVVGHIAIDRVIASGGCRRQLGGSPIYASLVARTLGLEAGVVTKVGGDMPGVFLDQLRGLGISLQGQVVEDAKTTRFTLDYRRAQRRLSVESVCEAIGPEDVRGLPEVVLISPIIGEVPPATAHAISAGLVALDPQGFVREVLRDGAIMPRPWFDRDLLRRVNIFKSSQRELMLVAGEDDPWRGLSRVLGLGPEAAVATRGAEGALLMIGGKRYFVPAYSPAEVVDPTGAGDAFMGGFLSEYIRGGEGPWCVAIGSAAASYVVEKAGVNLDASARELRRRAEEIYNGLVKF